MAESGEKLRRPEPALIETDRLRLRQWISGDREPFAQLNADPRVREFFPSILSPSESDAFADHFEAIIRKQGWGFWAAALKATGQFIGFVGLHAQPLSLPFSPCVEIGWRLAREFWGKGLATEAGKASVQFGFATLGLTEIVSFTSVGNARSRAVMKRLGMVESGTFEHPDLPSGHPLRQHCLYRLRAVDG